MLIDINNHTVHIDSDFIVRFCERKSWSVTKNKNMFYVRSGKEYLHRIVIGAKRGDIVDHINGNGLDNRLCNLRIVTRQGNKANSFHGKYTSKFIGVSFCPTKKSKPWKASAKINGKNTYLGYFSTEHEAASKYDETVKNLYGSSAITNFNGRHLSTF